MVIVNMDLQTGFHHDLRKFPDPADLTGVDQDQSFDLAEVNIFHPFHLKGIEGGVDEELSQAPFLGARKDQDRSRIEFFGCQHGSQGIEIRIRMGGDNFHKIIN
jgi:hypothetical protein